ncbi:putative phosphate transporter, phosphate binding protein [Chondrocystis sp. NIES-4102]|nr:putative phosphate transporter, phosphate binding protein [Chondrocystis sp. NIES-4102]
MLKKNDLLPGILALISTGIVLGFALMLLNEMSNTDNQTVENDEIAMYREASSQTEGKPTNDYAFQNTTFSAFPAPGIVPQGTLININSSLKTLEVNKALRRSFQKQFPGTVVNTNVASNEVGINLLRSGKIDLAAIDRPLNTEDHRLGLTVIPVDSAYSNRDQEDFAPKIYYAYQQPASLEVEAFLGYAFSEQGQQAIKGR